MEYYVAFQTYSCGSYVETKKNVGGLLVVSRGGRYKVVSKLWSQLCKPRAGRGAGRVVGGIFLLSRCPLNCISIRIPD